MGNRTQERVDIKWLQTEAGINGKRLPMIPVASAMSERIAVRSSRWLIHYFADVFFSGVFLPRLRTTLCCRC